jgi:dolichol-phosphate mannosyltransferase
VALAGGILAAYNIVYYFVASQPSGYTSLVVLVLLSSGFIILSIGIVGLYVGRVFEQVKFRPLFIISRSAGAGVSDGLDEPPPVADASQPTA